ncbi:hypothetical protein G6F56_003040 [Rhizopus delemar]|nr:hypothetical protein G6F56_003040 [Rhizopus delemar]
MELISKTRTTKGLTLENADYLNKATRNSTQKTYNSAWKKRTSWCRQQDPKIDATQYNVMKVIEFLLENKKLSSQTLNGIRSAIASIWKVLHPLETPLADQEVIRNFFEAKRKQEVRIPSQEQLMTWDTDILLKKYALQPVQIPADLKRTWNLLAFYNTDNTIAFETDIRFVYDGIADEYDIGAAEVAKDNTSSKAIHDLGKLIRESKDIVDELCNIVLTNDAANSVHAWVMQICGLHGEISPVHLTANGL